MEILESIVNGLLAILSPVFFVVSLVFKFLGHVITKAYWIIVAVLGTALAYYILACFIDFHF